MPRHQRDVLAPVAQRRHLDRHDVEPIEQILAEAAGADLAGKVAVRRRDDADIDLDPARPADPLEGLLLQRADDLALGLERHVGDLVEKQGAAMRALEGADLARRAIDAVLGAEQLDLEPLRPHRRAIERHERPLRAPRAQMQQPPDDLLAGAGRSGDQHPAAGRRRLVDLLAQLVGERRDPDQVDVAAGAQLELLVLAAQLGRLDGALDDEQQPVGFERLLDEIVGADLDRLDRGFDRAVAADHDHRHRRHLGAQQSEDFDPVELAALQPDVEDDEGRLPRMDHRQRLGAVAGLARGVALVLQHTRNQHADVGFVVDDQDVMRHGRLHSAPEAGRYPRRARSARTSPAKTSPTRAPSASPSSSISSPRGLP